MCQRVFKLCGIFGKGQSMTPLFQDKRISTRFQILLEVADNQPHVRQNEIARKIDITPQAVSQYMLELEKDGLVEEGSHSNHSVTPEGVNWLLKILRETDYYLGRVEKVTRNMDISAAVAACQIGEGDTVGLVMRDGLLLAVQDPGSGARGVAVCRAEKGQDVGISRIEGIIELQRGEVLVLKVPDIRKGGSRNVDLIRLKEHIGGNSNLGAIGVEAFAALKRLGITPRYCCGVKEVCSELARYGLSSVVVCTENEAAGLLQLLEERALVYQLIEMQLN
jgi:putative transcriptional regulator